MNQAWKDFIAQPFRLILYCFFQPTKFNREFGPAGRLELNMLVPFLKLLPVMLLISYGGSLFVHIFIYNSFLYVFSHPLYILEILWTTVLATLLGLITGSLFGFPGGTAGSITLGMIGGITGDVPFGNVIGLPGIFATSSLLQTLALAIALGFVALIASIVLIADYRIGLRAGSMVFIAIILAALFTDRIPLPTTAPDIVKLTTEDIVGGLLLGLGISLNIWIGFILGIVLSISKIFVLDFVTGIYSGSVFAVCYIGGYYRIMGLPFTYFLELRAARKIRQHPDQILAYLESSPYHWDERSFRTLPGMEGLLLEAAKQNEDGALAEIRIIIARVPREKLMAQEVAFTIAIKDLQLCDSLQKIGGAISHIEKFSKPEQDLLTAPRVEQFKHLKDASLDAFNYLNEPGNKEKREILKRMEQNLQRLQDSLTLGYSRQDRTMQGIADIWLETVQKERNRLEKIPVDAIENVYFSGQALPGKDSRFVGRRDIINQLKSALSVKGSRPIFFLTGERRIGKSSTLKQLPYRLDARYIPVYFDLQNPGVLTNTATFLSTIAEEIARAMKERLLDVTNFDYEYWRTKHWQNDMKLYTFFDQWFAGVEKTLVKNNITLLLMFDEYENFENDRIKRQLDVDALLKWFRAINQRSLHIAFLFCGAKDIVDMGERWLENFEYRYPLKLGFLRKSEAYNLITQPTATFPGYDVFSEEVIEKITEVTADHPFLLQSLCSAIIYILNEEQRTQASLSDVDTAAQRVLETFKDAYFRDLWTRLDQQQQQCLIAIALPGEADEATIAEKSGLGDKEVRQAIEQLLDRTLIRERNGKFRIIIPLVADFIKMTAMP